MSTLKIICSVSYITQTGRAYSSRIRKSVFLMYFSNLWGLFSVQFTLNEKNTPFIVKCHRFLSQMVTLIAKYA